jgi:oxygen-independent coproporphyrinogen-3 oxidase
VALGIYVHVPFCAARCGYCDFNTYLPHEATQAGYLPAVLSELDLARAELGDRGVDTIFLGGGTPTLLEAADLGRIIDGIKERFATADDLEVTVEANPETIDAPLLEGLLAGGVTRLSIGMQSAAPSVLATLDRVHTPGAAAQAALDARAAGFDHVSLDVIYGTPGETDADWELTLNSVLAAEPDHVSAYGLIVEPGTKLAAQVRRGELPAPDEDAMARRYEAADARLSVAGMHWYEMCNWARDESAYSRHNLGYWRSDDWWGIGPGAHSHIGGRRWWNRRHPAQWANALSAGESPASGSEEPTPAEQRLERIMLELRLAEGMPLDALGESGHAAVLAAQDDGLLDVQHDRAVLTLRGRLIADTVTHRLNV